MLHVGHAHLRVARTSVRCASHNGVSSMLTFADSGCVVLVARGRSSCASSDFPARRFAYDVGGEAVRLASPRRVTTIVLS